MKPFELRLKRLRERLDKAALWMQKEYNATPPPCKDFDVIENGCGDCEHKEDTKFCKQVPRVREIIEEMEKIQEANKNKEADWRLILYGKSA